MSSLSIEESKQQKLNDKDNNKWIPYDLAESYVIEEAFVKK